MMFPHPAFGAQIFQVNPYGAWRLCSHRSHGVDVRQGKLALKRLYDAFCGLQNDVFIPAHNGNAANQLGWRFWVN